MERTTTGSPDLDIILGGGIPQHSIVLLAGAPGSGKTILGEQFAFANGTAQRPALYLTTANESLDKVVRFGQQFDFFDASAIGSRVVYESLAEVLVEHGLPAVIERVVSLLTTLRPGCLIIDSLRALQIYASDDLEHRRFLSELAHRLSAMAITTLWVAEYEGEVLATPEAAVADAIVVLRTVRADQRALRYVEVLKLRGASFLTGEHAYRLSSAGIRVFPRLADPTDTGAPLERGDRIPLGGEGLNAMASGGVWPGTSTLVIGPSGAGKTMLGIEFLARGARDGRRGVLATLQESPTQLRRATTNGHRWPDDSVVVHHRSPVDVYVDEWIHEVFEVIARHDAELLLIDSLSDLRLAASDDKRFEEYVYSLAQRCSRAGITAVMTLESAPIFSLAALSGTSMSNLADNIVLLGYHRTDGIVRRAIHVLKTRASGHDVAVRELTLNGSSLDVGGVLPISSPGVPRPASTTDGSPA
jgi:circadian clock protein KaiC